MSLRKTQHPCPGCGKTDYYGTKGSLCHDCKETLVIGKKVQESRNAKANADTQVVTIPGVFYELPYFRHGNSSRAHKISDQDPTSRSAADMFRWHLYELLTLTSEPAPRLPVVRCLFPRSGSDSHYGFLNPIKMPTKVADHFIALNRFAEQMVDDAYAEGEDAGENMIARMAAGKLTVSDLNSLNIKAGERKK